MMKKTLPLNDGSEIPVLGLGTWLSRGADCTRAVEFALSNGYDHIDTAQGYDNEKQVGRGWKASGRNREALYITTKITNSNQGYDKSIRSLKSSLKALQTDYVDLLLIHWPDIQNYDRSIETWRALIDLQAQGLTRSIGVSNFTIPLLEQLISKTEVIPAINQVEFHTFLYQKELLDYSRDQGIQIEAYSPIARAKFFNHEQLQRVAKKYQKSPAQVMLAWCLNHNLVVIPKSTHEARILENVDCFFELDDEDLEKLDNLQPQRRLVDAIGLFDD
jgi:methylglyoxal/glyoxal reductase